MDQETPLGEDEDAPSEEEATEDEVGLVNGRGPRSVVLLLQNQPPTRVRRRRVPVSPAHAHTVCTVVVLHHSEQCCFFAFCV